MLFFISQTTAQQAEPEQQQPIRIEYDRAQPMNAGQRAPDQSGRLSPSALERKMAAELYRLDGVEESVRQLTDVERTRAVSLAQQETVSLAQILKVNSDWLASSSSMF